MNANITAQDSAQFVVTNWEDQIVEEDEFGNPLPIEPYSDEYQAPATASFWIAATGPDDLWNSRPLTEWEIGLDASR
jgi:hypothetical protein